MKSRAQSSRNCCSSPRLGGTLAVLLLFLSHFTKITTILHCILKSIFADLPSTFERKNNPRMLGGFFEFGVFRKRNNCKSKNPVWGLFVFHVFVA